MSDESRKPPPRLASDTTPIDRAELDELLAASLAPEDRPTGIECPACGALPRDPACTACGGDGWMSIVAWRRWVTEHGAQSLVTCPKCHGEAKCVEVIAKGRWHTVPCSLCRGAKRVRGNLAAAYERTTTPDSEP